MPRLLIVLIMCAALFSFAPQVFACSYAYKPVDITWNIRHEIVVAAEVEAVDDVGIGTILKVHRYFKGAGGEYLAIMPYPPALQIAGRLRWYHTGCTYTGGFFENWHKNDFVYVGLEANGDGTYSRGSFYRPQRGYVDYYTKEEGDATVTIADFETLLLEISGDAAASEPQSNPRPLMRFLHITTETGERYRLNPDRSLTWLDPASDPIAISNDGTHLMFQLGDDQLGFQYLAHTKKPIAPWIEPANSDLNGYGRYPYEGKFANNGWLHTVNGLFGTFSPDSNLVAIQEETRITVYLFSSVVLPGPASGFVHRMAIEEIASSDVKWRSSKTQQPLVWSGNSKAFAYQDEQGIWLWNTLLHEEPQFVASVEADQELIELSASGRYVRFGNRASWTLVDVLLGGTWKDSMVTPDESLPVHFHIVPLEDYAEIRQRLNQCKLPVIGCPIVILLTTETGLGVLELPMDVFWHDPYQMGLVYPVGVISSSWSESLWRLPNVNPVELAYLPTVQAFAYDAKYRRPAFVFEDTRIGLDARKWDNYDSVDLSEYLDSPIVDLEWGQPIFYEGR